MPEKEPQFGLREITGEKPEEELKEEYLRLETNLLPVESFEANTKEHRIEDITSNNNYTFIVRRVGEVPKIFIYDVNGRLVKKELPLANFTVEEYLNFHERKNSYIGINYSSSKENISTHLEYLCSKEDIRKVENIFKNLHKNLQQSGGDIHISSLHSALAQKEKSKALFDYPLKIKTNPEGDHFIVNYRERALAYKVREGDQNLAPEKWQEKIFANRQTVLAGDPKLPFIDEYFVYYDKSKIIPNTELMAVFEERGILSVIDKEKKTKFFSAGARDFELDPSDEKNLFYINTEKNTIDQVDISSLQARKWKTESREVKEISGEMQEIKLDPNGNFFIIQYKTKEGQGKLAILEKDTLKKVKEYENVAGKVEVDQVGSIYFSDNENQLRTITANFLAIPKGGLEALRKAEAERLKALSEKLEKLGKEEIRPKEKIEILDKKTLARELERKLEVLFEEKIEQAKNLATIDEIAGQIEVLKTDPDWLSYPQAFKTLEKKAEKKENALKTEDLRADIKSFKTFLESVSTLEQTLVLDQRFDSLLKERQEVVITDLELRKEIDQSIKTLAEKKEKLITERQGELLKKVEQEFDKVNNLMIETGSIDELNVLLNVPETLGFENLLAQIRDTSISTSWRKKFREARENQKEILLKKKEELEEKERFKAAQIIEEAGEILEEISSVITEQVVKPEELDKWIKRNPLITKYRSRILALPQDLRQENERRLEDLIKEKERDLEHAQALNIPKKGGEITFGKETFPVFEDIKVVWQPKLGEIKTFFGLEGRERYAELYFEDNFGRRFYPLTTAGNRTEIPADLGDPHSQKVVSECQREAKEYFEALKREVPPFNENWVLSDYYLEKLAEISKLLKIQTEQQRGILILEGEAGTGKNVLLDMLGHFSNREIFNLSCNFQTEKEDITYAFRFDPERGTYSVASELIEGLNTDGAIINLDEINTLPPGVAKMLNSLLDYRRTLYLPEAKKKIKARPSVLIFGTMNPQHYLGVRPLSQEVKSRARILFIDYPPEKSIIKGREKYAPDEPLILAKYTDSLRGLKQEEFIKLWDYVINQEKDSGGDLFLNKQREEDIKKIREIVKISNKIREAYMAFRTSRSNEIIEFVFSLRETIDIVSEMNHFKDVKEAIKDVVLPKISDPAEKARVKTIIENA